MTAYFTGPTTTRLPASAQPQLIAEAADLATVQVLLLALRQRLGAAGEELLHRFDDLHRRDRMLTEARRDLDARQGELERRKAAVAVLEQLVDERRELLMAEIVVIETMHRAAATVAPLPQEPGAVPIRPWREQRAVHAVGVT